MDEEALHTVAVVEQESLAATPVDEKPGEAPVDGSERRRAALQVRVEEGLRATPPAVVRVLHEATLEALKQPAVRERVEAQAGRITPGSGEALDKIVADDIKTYSKIVRERGIKAE